MYSRSLDRSTQTVLPEHYGGNAFRPDGTPTPIPVRRDIPPTYRPAAPPPLKIPEKASPPLSEDPPPHDKELSLQTIEGLPKAYGDESEREEESTITARPSTPHEESTSTPTFLGRLSSGFLPTLQSDDLLLLLLLYLLLGEEGNSEILILLAAVLLLG